VSRRRVLLTTDVVGGVWDFALALAGELTRDSTVVLLAIGEPSASQELAARGTGVELRSAPLKLEWMAEADADVARTADLVVETARSMGADVIHANQFAAACAKVDVPALLTVHSDVLSWQRWTLGASGAAPQQRAYVELVREAIGTK